MASDIASMRHDYGLGTLIEADAAPDAIAQFRRWFDDALAASLPDANAMTLATVDATGQPTARIVLLKDFDAHGFVFFTNYLSRKGQELAANPKASLLFFWAKLERQVRIDGRVTRTNRQISDVYFHSRPRAAQVGAWASAQSRVLASRAELELRNAELEKRFEGKPVPLPDNWGGYLLAPTAIEFWQGRESRLHDRLLYTPRSTGWKIERLSP